MAQTRISQDNPATLAKRLAEMPASQVAQEMEQALEEDPVDGDWVGCILVKDNKFYFGSYENQITGICLQQLRKVLGGNAK